MFLRQKGHVDKVNEPFYAISLSTEVKCLGLFPSLGSTFLCCGVALNNMLMFSLVRRRAAQRISTSHARWSSYRWSLLCFPRRESRPTWRVSRSNILKSTNANRDKYLFDNNKVIFFLNGKNICEIMRTQIKTTNTQEKYFMAVPAKIYLKHKFFPSHLTFTFLVAF